MHSVVVTTSSVSLGLTYGIPRFIPRKINRMAITNKKDGINLLIRTLKLVLINLPVMDRPNIMGMVPKPNRNI